MNTQTEPADHAARAQRRFELYADYAKMLRLWLVAYGIGAPVLFLTRPDVAAKLFERGNATTIAIIFLVGVAAQVLNAAVNKWAAWYIYAGVADEEFQDTRRYKVSAWISGQFWIDLSLDLAAMVLFAWATIETVFTVAQP
jgi:hypothetical protein